MIRPLACAALTLICFVTAAPAWAQSLGDVARKEAERRATAKKAVKSFSNADLNPSEISNPSAAPATSEGAAAAATDNQAKPATGTPANETNAAPAKEQAATPKAQKEPEWRANADAIRHSIEQAQAEYAKLAATAADTSRSAGERAGAERLATQQARTLERLERRWQQLEKQADELRVPREWLSPRPIFAPRIPR